MGFSDLLGKLVNGETLSPSEKQQILLDARRLEENSNLLSSLIQPGTKILQVDGLVTPNAKIVNANIDNVTVTDATITDATITNADIVSATTGNGDVTLDTSGISVRNNQQALMTFEDADGNRDKLFFYSNLANHLVTVIRRIGGGIQNFIYMTNADTPYMKYFEDLDQTNRTHFWLGGGTYGAKLQLSTDEQMMLWAQGNAGGYTAMQIKETLTNPPQVPSNAAQIYIKGGKLIVAYADTGGGTLRWKYLDLTGTGTTWVQTTSAP